MNLKLIRKICESRKGGVKGLALELGMSEQNLHRCIRENRIMANELEKISKILGVSPAIFFEEDINPDDYTATGTQGVAARHIEKLEQHSGEPTETQKQLTDTQARLIEAQQRIIDLLSSGKQENTPEE